LTQQPESDHSDDIAKLSVSIAHSVQGDRSKGGEGGFVKADGTRWNSRE
jgi:hypothetical protein